MSKDIYLSIRNKITGFSFANIGLFTGFATSIYGCVYSLILLDIFKNQSLVGIYISIYSIFCLIVSLFINEILRYFSKAKLFNFSLILLFILYFMMAFSIKDASFITLDFMTGFSEVLLYTLLPLFFSDFSKNIGIDRINSRYYFFVNIGCLFAPMLAMFIASKYGNRSVFFITSLLYFITFCIFKYFRIIQKDKKLPKKINFSRLIKSVIRNVKIFIKNKVTKRAYLVACSYYTLYVTTSIYVPIAVLESGFSKETLGIVLTIGILPYVFLSNVMPILARKYSVDFLLKIGFLSFAIFSSLAVFLKGYYLLGIFILFQFSRAIMESIYELLFFNNITKEEQIKYYSIFKTNSRLTRIIAPLIVSLLIALIGGISSVWLFNIIVCLFAFYIIVKK